MNPFLVTGFQPYGGRGRNPAHEIMRAIDGKKIGGVSVAGRSLPVSFAQLRSQIAQMLDDLNPVGAISIGLWPGEPLIRLERVGVNIADFEIADNDGQVLRDERVADNGPPARFATLPLREIEQALIDAGIPVRVSATAGTFLCNSCLYSLLAAAESRSSAIPCGFIHVPYMPEQVAELLAETRNQAHLEIHQRADLPSMDLSRSLKAVEIAIETTLRVVSTDQGRQRGKSRR